jgi:hypothetical protein
MTGGEFWLEALGVYSHLRHDVRRNLARLSADEREIIAV